MSVDPEQLKGFAEHWQILLDAHEIHVDRTPERGELWLDDGRDKMLECAKDKVIRLLHAAHSGQHSFREDDALDAINYLVFAIRCNRRGRIEREEWDDE